MTRTRYTPQMVVATVCVLLVPAVIVWLLHSHGRVTSFWVCVLLALGLTFLALTIGTSYWRRRRPPATVLFSDLMVWGWIRDQYLDHKLAASLRSLERLKPGDLEQRGKVLREIAAAVDAKDPFLTGHSQRVARYVTAVARRMHVERREADRIRTAALLHDVGKLHTPAEILMRPSKLSADDTTVMRRHAEDGAEMVATLSDPDLADIVRHHHERFDGTGYPSGLAGDAIPLGSRIIAVPDTFDAITSARPYRAAMPHQAALAVLRDEAGTQLDPAVVRAFIAEYTNRRGVMIWAAAQQLVPLARVAGVAAAAVALNAFTFVASTPSSNNSPPQAGARAAAQRTSPPHRTPSRAPRTQSSTATRRASAHGSASARARHSKIVRRATATAPTIGTAAAAQAPAIQPAPTQAGFQTGSHTQATRPISEPPSVKPSASPVKLAPETVAAVRAMGSAVGGGAAALSVPPSIVIAPSAPTGSTPGTGPTQPTQPTQPTTPAPTPTQPTAPAPPPATPSPTTPGAPENADQCKNGGWKTLGFQNQGQCIASVKHG